MDFYLKLTIIIYLILVSLVVLSGVYYCWFQFWYPSYKFEKEQRLWRKNKAENTMFRKTKIYMKTYEPYEIKKLSDLEPT
jgi:hypothetical protein